MSDSSWSRRGFLKTAATVAGVTVATPVLLEAKQRSGISRVYLDYPVSKIGSLSALKKSGELDFNYPDSNSPCKAVYIKGEVKAYSIVCTHKGCPVLYNPSQQTFVCPCHFTKFDAAKDGQMVIGQATAKLPQVMLKISKDDILAYAVEGLIFGRISNKL